MSLVDKANESMGALERVWAGLPGVKDYRNKELRREADKQVRTALATYLEGLRSRLTAMQQDLLSGGGMNYLPDVERAVNKLQLLSERVRNATYGYAGFFDAVKVREPQIEALANFDKQLADKAHSLEAQISALAEAMSKNAQIVEAVRSLNGAIQSLNDLFSERTQVIQNPDAVPQYLSPSAPASSAPDSSSTTPSTDAPAPASGGEPPAPQNPPTNVV